MKIILNPAFDSLSGALGGLCFHQNNGYQIGGIKPPGDTDATRQGNFTTLSGQNKTAWAALTAPQRAWWKEVAEGYSTAFSGQKGRLTSYAAYLKWDATNGDVPASYYTTTYPA